MLFETRTLIAITVVNLLTVSLALPVLMGRGVSRAARMAQGCVLTQTLGWVLLLASDYGFDQLLSTLSMTCMALSQFLLFHALALWLGRRPGAKVLLGLTVLIPLGYGMGFSHYSFRVGWANFLLATQMIIVARATLFPHQLAGQRWRWLLCICLLMMAGFTAARGYLGAFLTQTYPAFGAPHPVNLGALLATNVTMVVCTLSIMVAWREEIEKRLANLAMVDPLTGLLNRRGFVARAEAQMAQARRHAIPLVLLMLDIDFFKRVNDTYGHEAGDRALQLFARQLNENQRAHELVGRLGGEEFCVVLSHADVAAALTFDARLRAQLSQVSAKELGFTLEYSAGMAVYACDDETLPSLLARADKALYTAKEQGRNSLVQSERSLDALVSLGIA